VEAYDPSSLAKRVKGFQDDPLGVCNLPFLLRL